MVADRKEGWRTHTQRRRGRERERDTENETNREVGINQDSGCRPQGHIPKDWLGLLQLSSSFQNFLKQHDHFGTKSSKHEPWAGWGVVFYSHIITFSWTVYALYALPRIICPTENHIGFVVFSRNCFSYYVLFLVNLSLQRSEGWHQCTVPHHTEFKLQWKTHARCYLKGKEREMDMDIFVC